MYTILYGSVYKEKKKSFYFLLPYSREIPSSANTRPLGICGHLLEYVVSIEFYSLWRNPMWAIGVSEINLIILLTILFSSYYAFSFFFFFFFVLLYNFRTCIYVIAYCILNTLPNFGPCLYAILNQKFVLIILDFVGQWWLKLECWKK